MATVTALRGVRFNPEHVRLGGVLAPPYDVIDEGLRERLYARDLRNVVRIDYCKSEPDDTPGTVDRYTRAAGHLQSWLQLGILTTDQSPCIYVTDHEFLGSNGKPSRRRGIYVRMPARPWADAEILPHERTMRGPKQDRLELMRATHMQTSAVWALWDKAPGMAEALEQATAVPADAGGRTDGELDSEKHLVWAVSDGPLVARILAALAESHLYIADGHHRYETAVAYADERRAADPAAPPDADFGQVLLYLCAADDPALELLPTHRLVRPDAGIPVTLEDLANRLPEGSRVDKADSLKGAVARAADSAPGGHRIAVRAAEGAACITIPRSDSDSPAAQLDVVALQKNVLERACRVTPDRVAEGILGYTRSVSDIDRAVSAGEAALGFALVPCTTRELIAVSDAHEVMPQKSTYFYPKVPTGVVFSPL